MQSLRVGLRESRQNRSAFAVKRLHLRANACASLYHEFHGFAQLRIKKFVFRGLGGPVERSATLFCVSLQPPATRKTALVLLAAGAGAEPSKQLAVLP